MIIVFNTTFYTIAVISWRGVLLVEETVVPGENNQSCASHWNKFYHFIEIWEPYRCYI